MASLDYSTIEKINYVWKKNIDQCSLSAGDAGSNGSG